MNTLCDCSNCIFNVPILQPKDDPNDNITYYNYTGIKLENKYKNDYYDYYNKYNHMTTKNILFAGFFASFFIMIGKIIK
jgi:hypothetical protein